MKMCLSDLLLQGAKVDWQPQLPALWVHHCICAETTISPRQCTVCVPVQAHSCETWDFSNRRLSSGVPILSETSLALHCNLRFFLFNPPFFYLCFSACACFFPSFFRYFPNKSHLIPFWHLLPGRPDLTKDGTIRHNPQSYFAHRVCYSGSTLWDTFHGTHLGKIVNISVC